MKTWFLFVVLGVLLFGCGRTTIEPPPPAFNVTTSRIAILCEGNFMWGNARLDIWQPQTSMLVANAYESVNKKPIGDVLQSGLVYGNNLFLVVNNSGKVIAVNPQSLKQTKLNATLKSPRYALGVGATIWVTDLYANKISVLDTSNLKTLYEITVPGWTEQLVYWNNQIAVACYKGKVLLFDPDTRALTQTLTVDSGVQYLCVDAANKLWVSGSLNGKSSVKAFEANRDFAFVNWNLIGSAGSIQSHGYQMFLSVNNTIQTFEYKDSNSTDMKKIVDLPIKQLYGYFVEPKSRDLYVADAKDYVSNGQVFIVHLNQSNFISTINTGVNPSGFVFLP